MSIDWITVAAQIANFLLLMWLLRRFLYRPILDGIDAREVEISDRMQEAVHAKEQAQAEKQSYLDKVQALNVAQSEMTETIRRSAEEQRDVLLAETQKRLQQENATWKAHLDDETHKYTAKMHRAGAEALLSLTRKALNDLADETLETRVAHHLIQQITPMVPDLKRAAGQAAQAVIISQSALPAAVKDELTTELQKAFPQSVVRFETDETQAPGLVLRVGGAQLAWTVESYIDGLSALIDEQLASGGDLKVKSHEQ
ncbi:F0F1 ATP synthase subunit delta [Pacificibacter marinus]|uniref:ATP synthase subunit b n=1 Tax=Pacificibacter marinus TaxID=658057 RepID=A0A1Y5SY22_9RHOB|nr:F0F1 ATP synthase subunit B [Pacificibacter marinus]SEK84481.1 ATP synthase F0 subcomplex B subunit [Pacificibacter marinus]SLN49116.1 F0F1 ATP synthase subunit B [Pacificibacter marinus]